MLEEPLGNARLHGARLMAALLHTNTPGINRELCRLDTMGLLLVSGRPAPLSALCGWAERAGASEAAGGTWAADPGEGEERLRADPERVWSVQRDWFPGLPQGCWHRLLGS